VSAYLFCAVSLIPKITPTFFLSPLSPGFIFRYLHVLLAPCSRARCSGLCPGDSVPCITLQVAGLFLPQFIGTLGFQSIRDRANEGCFEVYSSVTFGTRNYFRSSNHSIGSSCDHPSTVSPCHGIKLAF
jgi:hypothetical protein